MTIDTSPDAPIPSVLSKLDEIRKASAWPPTPIGTTSGGSWRSSRDRPPSELRPAAPSARSARPARRHRRSPPSAPTNRTALLELLTAERLGDLGIPARAALASALQRGRTGSLDEQALRRLWLGTRGADVTRLKNALDGRGGYRDLHQLFYHDIDDDALREELLAHFAREAVSASRCSLSRSSSVSVREVKILSDIDDTFYAELEGRPVPEEDRLSRRPAVLLRSSTAALAPRRGGPAIGPSSPPAPATASASSRTRRSRRSPSAASSPPACSRARSPPHRQRRSRRRSSRTSSSTPAAVLRSTISSSSATAGEGDIHFGQRMLGLALGGGEGDASSTTWSLHLDLARRELATSGVHLFDTYIGAALVRHRARPPRLRGRGRVAEATIAAFAAILSRRQADQETRRLGDVARARRRPAERGAAAFAADRTAVKGQGGIG